MGFNEKSFNKFVGYFRSKHLTTEGIWIYQHQKRFILADDIKAAEKGILNELNDPKYWPKGFHEWDNLTVRGCAGAEDWPGYDRFSNNITTENGRLKSKLLFEQKQTEEKLRQLN